MENANFEILMANLFLIAGLICSGADWIYWALFTGIGFIWLLSAMLRTLWALRVLDVETERFRRQIEEIRRKNENEKRRTRN